MFLLPELKSLSLAVLLLGACSTAAPHAGTPRLERRDDPSTSGADGPTASLEPVVPPEVNPDALSILALGTHVNLAWAGSPADTGTKGMLKRAGAVLTQAAFTFAYPTVPLDHSSFVSGISCSGNTLTGTLTSSAYTYAKKQWSGASDIVFVTSVDGCGTKDANDFFHATKIIFSDGGKTFSATGSSAGYKSVATHMSLTFGDVGTHKLKRAVDKRDMFEPHPLHRRARAEFTLDWSAYASDILGIDDDAPWDNAALLFKWGKEGGEEDGAYKKGEVADPNGHHKRSNVTDLAKRELDYGLALYCVECGFGGSATIWGQLDVDIGFFTLDVTTAQVGFNANFKAGLNLGMEAYVKYEKEWEKELAKIQLGGFEIPLLLYIGPFVSLSVEAKAGISATGSLLIGAAVAWDNVDIVLDLLHSDGSHANGLIPRFEHKAEATGELKIEASIGLPVRLGIEVDILEGSWTADAAIKDTPSINAEGKFEVSATVTDDGEIAYDINGGCYGIAWDIHFENTLQAVIEADGIGSLEIDLIEPQKSDPIAEGCIGYVDDGTDDGSTSDSQGIGSGTGTTGNGLKTGANGLSGGSGSVKGSVAASVGSSSTSSTSTTMSTSTPASTSSSSTSTSVNKGSSTIVTTTASTSVNTAKVSSSTTASSSSTAKASSSSTATSSISTAKTSASSSTPSTTPSPTKATSTSTKAATTTSTKPACTPSQVIANPTVPTGLTCKKIVAQASVATSLNVGKATTVNTADICAANCLKEAKCVSFSYNDKKACQLYNKAVKSVGVTTKKGEPQLTFYDKQCYAYSTCPK